MRVHTRSVCATTDVSLSIRQVEVAFSKVVAARAGHLPDFEHLTELVIFTSTYPGPDKLTRSTRRDVCYVTQPIAYKAWIAADWPARVDLMAAAFLAGLEAVPKKRILDEERTALRDILEAVRLEARISSPAYVEKITPAFLDYAPPAPVEEQMFKLYQRIDGRLQYREGWFRDNHVVTQHWGACGERGQVCEHACDNTTEARSKYKSLKVEALNAGFKSIPPSRHATLVVEVPIDGMGNRGDLDRRHALEEFLDQQTGWLGLGHCDGGSSGSGSMEAFCIVVDFAIAKSALAAALSNSPFSDFSKIYRMPR